MKGDEKNDKAHHQKNLALSDDSLNYSDPIPPEKAGA